MWFGWKLSIFSVPFAVGFLLLTGSLVYTGESMPLGVVIRMQDNVQPVLYRPGYGNVDQRYKRMAVEYFKPEVLVIGSSRQLQFRAHFLTRNPGAFYNAAAPAWQLEEVLTLLQSSSHIPRIILLGLDDAVFNSQYTGDPIVEEPVSDYARIFIVNRTFMQHIIHGERYDPKMYLNRDEPGGSGGIALGIRAIKDGHGFRNDGSEQYGDFLVAQHLWPPNLRGLHMGWFEDGVEMYVEGDKVDADAMQQLNDILTYATENNVLLIGFSPPYMPSLWSQLETSDRHTYIPRLIQELTNAFAEHGYPYFSFHDGHSLGATDEDFFDGWHPSERVAAQLFIELAQEVPELTNYSDLVALQQVVDTAPDTFRVFPFVAQQ